MKFGLHSVNLHSCSYPDAAARVGRAAEAAGFESEAHGRAARGRQEARASGPASAGSRSA